MFIRLISKLQKDGTPTTHNFDFTEDPDPYGGYFIERLARFGDPFEVKFNIPMQKDNSTDMSYSGLWTSVRFAVKKNKKVFEENGPSIEHLQHI
jgi:tRNA A37 threonylcarbamoyltransferase TsaD